VHVSSNTKGIDELSVKPIDWERLRLSFSAGAQLKRLFVRPIAEYPAIIIPWVLFLGSHGTWDAALVFLATILPILIFYPAQSHRKCRTGTYHISSLKNSQSILSSGFILGLSDGAVYATPDLYSGPLGQNRDPDEICVIQFVGRAELIFQPVSGGLLNFWDGWKERRGELKTEMGSVVFSNPVVISSNHLIISDATLIQHTGFALTYSKLRYHCQRLVINWCAPFALVGMWLMSRFSINSTTQLFIVIIASTSLIAIKIAFFLTQNHFNRYVYSAAQESSLRHKKIPPAFARREEEEER
jgi:hypothetical protein